MRKTETKELYISPECEVMDTELEGVIAASGLDPKFNNPFGTEEEW